MDLKSDDGVDVWPDVDEDMVLNGKFGSDGRRMCRVVESNEKHGVSLSSSLLGR